MRTTARVAALVSKQTPVPRQREDLGGVSAGRPNVGPAIMCYRDAQWTRWTEKSGYEEDWELLAMCYAGLV